MPFGFHDLVVLLGVLDADLGIFLLALELQLQIEQAELGVLEVLRLLLEAGVGEGLLECDAVNEERISDGASGDHLDPDEVLVEEVRVKVLDGSDNQF